MYERNEIGKAKIAAEWSNGVTWIAHPREPGLRASHAIRGRDGTWLFDPVDAENLDEVLERFNDIQGVSVLSSWHARSSDEVAQRYSVDIHLPKWISRIEKQVDSNVNRYTKQPGDSGFRLMQTKHAPRLEEAYLFDGESGSLLIPDSMGTTTSFRVGNERLGLGLLHRLNPPMDLLQFSPERVLVGHGYPVEEGAEEALRYALRNPRRTFPRAVLETAPSTMKSMISAIR